jgi:hypothetical protein
MRAISGAAGPAPHVGRAPGIQRAVKNLTVWPRVRACLFNLLRYRESGNENADMQGMSIGSVTNLGSYLQSILGTALQGTGLTSNTTGNSPSSISSLLQTQPDNGQLSPFAQLMSTLQQLQQSNPTEYKQVTQQIATNLQNAAKTATADGNTSAASQLTQLATDFTNASQSGQLPNIQDLAQAVGGGGHHHHHHHGHAAASSSSTDSSSSSTSTSSTSTASTGSTSPLDQLLAAFQANSSQNDALNPMSIIMNTLSSSGINLG